MNILYLAHDLDDSAIWRRVSMLERGGARVRVMGFRRGEGALPGPAELLGQTENGKMVARIGAVLRILPGIGARVATEAAPDVIVARNLEMLALAVATGRRLAHVPIVYELLDIHRLMLGRGLIARTLRRVEAYLMRRSALVMLSSPGFERAYLDAYRQPQIPRLLVENKPLLPEGVAAPARPARLTPASPSRLTIAWYGILRCAWSLDMLDRMTRMQPGRYRVLLRGKPALDAVPRFHEIVARNPDLEFHGPYRWPDDLAAIYGETDFTWLIDRYDAAANSDWLLPNRLYEGALYGAVPIALRGTEVAARLEALGLGLIAPAPEGAAGLLARIDAPRLAELRRAVAAQPIDTWLADTKACRALTARLSALPRGPRHPHHPLAQKGTVA